MPDPLTAATASLESAREAWRLEVIAASQRGESNRSIAKRAGVSYEQVRRIVTAAKPDDLTVLVSRLEELDARWELFVDRLAQAYFVNPDAKREQLRRNTENGKRKRVEARAAKSVASRGLRPGNTLDLLPTVASEARRAAETYVLDLLERNREHPGFVEAIRELDEAAALREQIASRTDPVWLHD